MNIQPRKRSNEFLSPIDKNGRFGGYYYCQYPYIHACRHVTNILLVRFRWHILQMSPLNGINASFGSIWEHQKGAIGRTVKANSSSGAIISPKF